MFAVIPSVFRFLICFSFLSGVLLVSVPILSGLLFFISTATELSFFTIVTGVEGSGIEMLLFRSYCWCGILRCLSIKVGFSISRVFSFSVRILHIPLLKTAPNLRHSPPYSIIFGHLRLLSSPRRSFAHIITSNSSYHENTHHSPLPRPPIPHYYCQVCRHEYCNLLLYPVSIRRCHSLVHHYRYLFRRCCIRLLLLRKHGLVNSVRTFTSAPSPKLHPSKL